MNQKKELRSGYTTGSCAAAATKAAIIALTKEKKPEEVKISLPAGEKATFSISNVEFMNGEAVASVIKDAGDDPDVTNGLAIKSRVKLNNGGIILRAGRGVGIVTRPGLAVPVGQPAINPVPRAMITEEAKNVLPGDSGAIITIEAPGGEELAARTLNPRLGIKGGISILGTSGIVRPMSNDAYKRSLVPQIDQAVALGYSYVILTPGRMGADRAQALGFPPCAIVQTSNFIGDMLEESAKRKLKGVMLFGHIGKLIKVAAGIFQTHSKLADARRETLAAHAALLGAGQIIIKRIMELNTMDESIPLLREHGLLEVFVRIAEQTSLRASQYCNQAMDVGTVLYALSGEILGYDAGAVRIGGELGWEVR